MRGIREAPHTPATRSVICYPTTFSQLLFATIFRMPPEDYQYVFEQLAQQKRRDAEPQEPAADALPAELAAKVRPSTLNLPIRFSSERHFSSLETRLLSRSDKGLRPYPNRAIKQV